ncbi:MAG: 4-oxalomesaconate tautomerase [Phenylobacterium sp.]|uniref:4-oxalomesaconate tautomerase n=1 Tax=Phenylobacterium sp. TaxID=1871053 RepID=UPI00120D8BCE|nr:4-oxalomesaconate tautomerase [Phenylobacterium sp.]TAJ72447.1 MAG: 4-oxalomesaconate tautomerase [Phenylobacterium sp.]
MTQTAIPCTVMRGGTSKGLYFRLEDLPADTATRDAVLLAAMGSPDARQIDGMGGAHPLTSKIALVGPPTHPDADVDYLFLQAVVDEARIDAGQNCGNLLAGVGPFAIEEGMFAGVDGVTNVRIHMLNTGSLAVAAIQTPGGQVRYDGEARIDGVPGTAAPVPIDFLDVAGSTCGALLPTGNVRDTVQGIEVTAIDNGMPVVVMRAADFGKTGYEAPEALEADAELKARVEAIRLEIGPRMNLGDVAKKTVPKMCLVAPAKHGGAICTRNFIPHRVHEAIGVFGAVSVATACVTLGSVAAQVAGIADVEAVKELEVEHPTGFFTVAMDVALEDGAVKVRRSALLRTCRRLMRGEVYVPSSAWGGP